MKVHFYERGVRMEITNLQYYLQHNFSKEEIAEEFGAQKTMVERDLTISREKQKKQKKGVKGHEKATELQRESRNSSR